MMSEIKCRKFKIKKKNTQEKKQLVETQQRLRSDRNVQDLHRAAFCSGGELGVEHGYDVCSPDIRLIEVGTVRGEGV